MQILAHDEGISKNDDEYDCQIPSAKNSLGIRQLKAIGCLVPADAACWEEWFLASHP
jgi:hypothetical protein